MTRVWEPGISDFLNLIALFENHIKATSFAPDILPSLLRLCETLTVPDPGSESHSLRWEPASPRLCVAPLSSAPSL